MRTEPRRILLVGNFLSARTGRPAGSEELAARLGASGWGVMTTSTRLHPAARLVDMLRTVWRRRDHYAVAQVDVFSGRAFAYTEAVGALLRLLGKPYVLTLHGGNLPTFGRRWPRRTRSALQAATAVTVPSRYLLEAMRIYRPDVRLLPNALDVGRYAGRVRHDPQPRLLWLRAFHRIYNPTMAVAVMSALATEFSDVTLVMLGGDKGDGSLAATRAAVAAYRVTERVTLPGAVPHARVPEHLQHADVFLNTADVDNAPVSLLEAMAAGLCIVSTRVGGVPYLLEHERDALLVPPNDARAMANAVRRVLTEPGLAGRLSRNACAKAERFDWGSVLPQWDALLRRVAGASAA